MKTKKGRKMGILEAESKRISDTDTGKPSHRPKLYKKRNVYKLLAN